MLNFGTHAKELKVKVAKRTNVLKALAGTTWGSDKETLLLTYKALGRSILSYAAPVWSPFLSKTHWQSLQAAQNSAERAATGMLRATNVSHLHKETRLLPVFEHSKMMATQFLLRCLQKDHPLRPCLSLPSGRELRNTLHGFTLETARRVMGTHFCVDTVLTPEEYRQSLSLVH